MSEVLLGSLPIGSTFLCGWRPEGKNVGELLDVSTGSVSVRIPTHDGSGFETTRWSLGTPVVPTERNEFYTQANAATDRNRSLIENPVERVWAICNENIDLTRDGIIAKCVAEGINFSTAKTQFYAWRKKQ